LTDHDEVWIETSSTRLCNLVTKLPTGYSAGQFLWSSDAGLLAFEVFNVEGHSPLTTTHVWVVKSDGTGQKEAILPSPNQDFSTRIDRWLNTGFLRIRSSLPGRSGDVDYNFQYDSGKIGTVN
jgi:hypothetical protein